uniref:Phloem filament protein n=1 Tax=Cucurbita maxima TaxID=3661 RepID=P94012_CUCMA|nr:phloem filament protein [Cucurbita maxima]
MSFAVKVCGQVPAVEKWIKIPDVSGHCVQEVAKLAVEQFNVQHGHSLKYDSIHEGWYCELGQNNLKYRLHIRAIDFLQRSLLYEALVFEEKPKLERIRKLISFLYLLNGGHYVGPVDPPQVEKWIKIPDLRVPFVQEVSKFAIDEYNKGGEGLKYVEIYDGWYAEMGQDNIKFRLHVKAKDCLGRLRNYEAIVLVKQFLSKKIKILESFKFCDQGKVSPGWNQIPDVKELGLQVVIKFIVEQIKIKFGDSLKFEIVYEGWYFELCPNSLKYRFHVKVIDFLGRSLKFEIIIIEERRVLLRIWKLDSIIVIVSPEPQEKKWIKIPNVQVPLVQELAKFAVDEHNKNGDGLKYIEVYEGWFMDLGHDNIKFRLHLKAKDWLGRIRNYEAVVLVEHFWSKRIKILESFKLCGPLVFEPKWIQIPNLKELGLQVVIKFIVEQIKIKFGDSLKFEIVYEGWYFGLCPNSLKYRFHVKVIDFLGRPLKFEVVIIEEIRDHLRIWKLDSIIAIVSPEPQEKKWIKIPNVQVPLVQELAKFAVDEHNKNGDGLKYIEVYEGWFMDLGHDNIKFRLHLKAKDWLGRIRNYEAVVLVEHFWSKRIKILESFKFCGPLVFEPKWIQIPNLKEPGFQVVINFIVEQLKIILGDCLKFHSIYEGWYFELCPISLKFRLHIKAIDFLGRCLNYEIIIIEEKRIFKLESIIVILSPGHCVGPVDPPKVEKWIKISNLQFAFLQEVSKFALDDFNVKSGDSLRFDGIYDGWYMEMGQDNIKFRIHLRAKDCLSRVHHYEAYVYVKQFLSKRIKIVESFKLIERKC